MKLTKRHLLNYLIDVLGHGVDGSNKIAAVYGTTYLTAIQLKECIEYNK